MSLTPFLSRAVAPIAIVLVAGCAGAGPDADFDSRDPYRSTNEAIHDFNLTLDRNVLRPVAEGYGAVTPTLVKHMIGNAVSHIDTINDFANYMLQGDLDGAGTAFGRFGVNTVVGGLGLLDPATEFGLPKEDTDFGITLGSYGVEEGAYLVLPFFGPSTLRDAGGVVGDAAMNPLTYSGFSDASFFNAFNPVFNVVEVVDARHRNADLVDDLLYESDNSYVSLRAVYLQRRDAQIRAARGEEADALPDIFDDAPSN